MIQRLLSLALAAAFALAAFPVAAQLPNPSEIEGDRVHTLLPPDGIPSIDQPEYVSAEEADFMKNDEIVVGVVHNGVAKAYSTWFLDNHEIVNDVFGDDPLAVTW